MKSKSSSWKWPKWTIGTTGRSTGISRRSMLHTKFHVIYDDPEQGKPCHPKASGPMLSSTLKWTEAGGHSGSCRTAPFHRVHISQHWIIVSTTFPDLNLPWTIASGFCQDGDQLTQRVVEMHCEWQAPDGGHTNTSMGLLEDESNPVFIDQPFLFKLNMRTRSHTHVSLLLVFWSLSSSLILNRKEFNRLKYEKF